MYTWMNKEATDEISEYDYYLMLHRYSDHLSGGNNL